MRHGRYLLRARITLKNFSSFIKFDISGYTCFNNRSEFENLKTTHKRTLFLIIGGIAVKY